MAGSAAVQSVVAGSFACVTNRINKSNTQFFVASLNLPRLHRINTPLRVRCMAEGGDRKEQPEPITNSPPPTPSPPTPKVSTKFSDVLAFGGPGPERINGRLAMVGFVAAMAVELSNGQDVFAQISNEESVWSPSQVGS
ncbi:hypothetical protein TIFTF001_015969 [Ficus carica]|uniref:Uncharacterized protein n=1 Tax=Ficus carica TaxID=3494 RepID=A0AA88A9Q9_FICCA|nr:hypothetical protein TIFTF001_015969 [Ficus carica]